ncbi:hypothetical protein B0H11DRAFT_2155417 [Mycena galericulata]|nr:hypothetical protein B0H11DRAFT_2155417 [Mycena galericulata]
MGTPKKNTKKIQSQRESPGLVLCFSAKKTDTVRPRTTRSSKARLLSDPLQNTALLTEQLRSLGLYAAPTLGDGNCLFRALSDQLYGSPTRHAQLRKDVCDWIARHKARYEPFVEDERGLDVHLKCMRENATYGGHMELSAFAHLTRRNVKVIQPGLVYVIEWAAGAPLSPTLPSSSTSASSSTAIANPNTTSTSTLSISASVYHDWEHFSSIRNLKGPHTGLPVVRETPAPAYPSYPPSPTLGSDPKQSKADAKERKRLEREGKERARRERAAAKHGHAGEEENDRHAEGAGTEEVTPKPKMPKVRLKLSSASPTKAAPPALPPSTTRLRSADRAAEGQVRVQRSPKRSFDESSGGGDGTGSESESVAKRTRSAYRYATRGQAAAEGEGEGEGEGEDDEREEDEEREEDDEDADGDVEMESDAEAEDDARGGEAEERASGSSGTSGTSLSLSLSPPALSSSSSLSSLSSVSPSPPPPDKVAMTAKPLTRRQRKALGIPKTRATVAAGKSGAGKIVIPGGRYEGTGEWRRNGTGRLDVRGFRELKI